MDAIRALVQTDLDRVNKKIVEIANLINVGINEISPFLCFNSKRIRTILTLLYLKACNCEISDKIVTLLAAGELIHNASLLHDDVVDASIIRRGKENFVSKYGSKISVLIGDYILSEAVILLEKLDNKHIQGIFINAVKIMSASEIMQYINRNADIGEKEYLKTISGKTASLFSAIMESSAELSGLNTEKAASVGKTFGILFQINNDFSSASIANDNQNGVKTAVSILGVEKTNSLKDNYREELRREMNDIPESEYKQGIINLVGKL